MFTLFAEPAKARMLRPVVPSPVKIKPGKTRLNPDFEGIPTTMRSSGFEVPPYSIVNSTSAVLVFVAYSHTSSSVVLLVLVV